MIELLFLINSVRGVPLAPSDLLTERAATRAEELCQTGLWSHEGWAKSFHGTDFVTYGENLARGFDDSKAAHSALMASPSHRRNILKLGYEEVGIAAGECGVIVQLFGEL